MPALRPVLSSDFARDVRLAAARAGMTVAEYFHEVVHAFVQADLRQRQQAAGLVEAVKAALEDGVPVIRGER